MNAVKTFLVFYINELSVSKLHGEVPDVMKTTNIFDVPML